MSTDLSEQGQSTNWNDMPVDQLIEHIIHRFHERHRVQLPEIIRLARRVEHVHEGSSGCPVGLADLMEELEQELESHMLKEEQVLFPMLIRGMNLNAKAPISIMRFEHDEHSRALADITKITQNITAPVGACNTWLALYGALQQFHNDLIQHIQLENNVLFLNASNAVEGAQHA